MIVRLIVFLFIIWGLAMAAVWLVASQLRKFISRAAPKSDRQKQAPNQNQHQPKIAAELVCCATCGTYIPEEQAISDNNCYYCSETCQQEQNK